jgi:hypothetical protein
MTVTITTSTVEGTAWIHLTGTIQEVLDELANQSASALNVSYWTDNGSTASAVMCRQE